MTTDEAQELLRRYRASPAYPGAGEPFGYSIMRLKTRIRKRLLDRGMSQMHAHFQGEKIYHRIMRYQPTFAQYCQAQAVLRAERKPVAFTREQLEHIVSLWSDANDPVSREIAAIARKLITC